MTSRAKVRIHLGGALRTAIELAKRGVPVFPCAHTKNPLTPNGHKDATTDIAIIERWWRRSPSAIVGVPTGHITQWLVVDIDPDGRQWFRDNEHRLNAKRIHRTKRGYHLLYRMPSKPIVNSAGKIAKGVDVRAEGGYVIWWPAAGMPTQGELDDIGDIPEWLLSELRSERNAPVSGTEKADIVEGGRNEFLSRRAFHLRKEGLSVVELKAVLQAINLEKCKPPLEAEEVDRIAVNKHKIDPEALWQKPTPLVRPLPPAAAYPIDALGPILSPAAQAIVEIVQVPPAIAGNAVLTAAALAAQRCRDVETLGGNKPISLYALTIAASGDRKTTVDRIALAPVVEHVKRLAKEYKVDLQIYEDERAESNKQRREGNADSCELEPPQKPWILCTEPTGEGLIVSLLEGQFSQGVFSDEGATLIGGYALSEDAELRTIGMFSRAWDGSPLDRVRAMKREHVTLYGRRLSMHLMAQPAVAARLLHNPLYRQQGFLARWLIAAPDSIAGTRLFNHRSPNAATDRRLMRYNVAIKQLLELPVDECPDLGGLLLSSLRMSEQAKALLTRAYDEFEVAQRRGGRFEQGREWASKAAEHASRISAVLALVRDPKTETVKRESMRSALTIVRHHIGEYLRLVGTASISMEMEHAEQLRQWLCSKGRTDVTVRHVIQRGPAWIREARKARAVLATLEEFHWVKRVGSKYLMHPELLVHTK